MFFHGLPCATKACNRIVGYPDIRLTIALLRYPLPCKCRLKGIYILLNGHNTKTEYPLNIRWLMFVLASSAPFVWLHTCIMPPTAVGCSKVKI